MFKGRRRTFIRLVLALTVSLAVCDAEGLGATPANFFWNCSTLLSFQMERPAQKAPCDLGFWRINEDAAIGRSLASGGSPVVHDLPAFRYTLNEACAWSNFFGCRIDAFESPRAPPHEGQN